jgi:hypothetical protein
MGAGKIDLADKSVKIVYGRFIGNGSYKTCARRDTRKHSELFQLGVNPADDKIQSVLWPDHRS